MQSLPEQQQISSHRKLSGSLNSLSSTKSTEALHSTTLDMQRIISEVKGSRDFSDQSPIQPEGLYSEPEKYQNAWKVHGSTYDDQPENKGKGPRLPCQFTPWVKMNADIKLFCPV